MLLNVFTVLTEKNFETYAMQYYDNPQCLSVDEFHEDLARFKYIKRLLRKYVETDEIKVRLILNHLIAIYNVFPIAAANHMICYRIEKDLWGTLKPFLVFLNYLPEGMMSTVKSNMSIVKKLQDI